MLTPPPPSRDARPRRPPGRRPAGPRPAGAGPSTSAATGSAMPAWPGPSTRQRAMSASLPGSSEPISSSRPRQRAPSRVPSASAPRTVIAAAPPRERAASSAWRSSTDSSPASLEAAPSTPRPTVAPAARRSAAGAMPAPRRAFDDGQWATAVPVAASRAISGGDRWTQCASQTSGPSQPSSSRYSTGRTPNRSRQNASSSGVSARWVCRRTPRRRASSAASRMSPPVTENGEQGATATRSIEPGDGSCQRSMASSVAARTASRSSTTSSGGRPPCERPRSMEPRQGWKRRPTSRAARIEAPSRSPAPGGKR